MSPPQLAKEINKSLQDSFNLYLEAQPATPTNELERYAVAETPSPTSDTTKQAIAAYSTTLGILLHAGEQLEDEDAWWAELERQNTLGLSLYLVQTAPIRLFSLLTLSRKYLQQIQDKDAIFPFSAKTVVTTCFPLSFQANAITEDQEEKPKRIARYFRQVSVFNPFRLTKGEIRAKRAGLRSEMDRVALSIGVLLQNAPDQTSPVSMDISSTFSVKSWLSATLDRMETATKIATRKNETVKDDLLASNSIVSGIQDDALEEYYASSLLPLIQHRANILYTLRRPAVFTRLWPVLLIGPVVGRSLINFVMSRRVTIAQLGSQALQTLEGLVVDWILEPLGSIMETLRSSNSGQVGSELISDVTIREEQESFKRMVQNFAQDNSKDSVGTDQEQLELVMRAWEQAVRAPFSTAITGNFVSPLLLTIQKTKLETLLLVSGLQALLHSQRLTLGFVGVAPAIMLAYAAFWSAKAVVGTFLGGVGGISSANHRVKRKECWVLLRKLDSIIETTYIDEPTASTSQVHLTGHLVLLTSRLRSYAYTHFPSNDPDLKEGFLDDLRAIEMGVDGISSSLVTLPGSSWNNMGLRLNKISEPKEAYETRKRALERLWRWSRILGWDESFTK